MNCGVLVPPMNAHGDGVGCLLVLGNTPLRCAFAHLPNEFEFFIQQESSMMKCLYLYSIMIAMLRVATSESRIPRPCFQILQTSLIYCFTASLLPAIFTSDRNYRLPPSIPSAF